MSTIEQIVRITTDGNETRAEVVGTLTRCSECKHRFIENNVWQCPFGLMIIPDGFCNYGERKDNTDG